jgi:hypothetical protein
MDAHDEGAGAYAAPPWLVPREYIAGGRNWMSRAINVLSREMHPILAQFGRTTVCDLPESDSGSSGSRDDTR